MTVPKACSFTAHLNSKKLFASAKDVILTNFSVHIKLFLLLIKILPDTFFARSCGMLGYSPAATAITKCYSHKA